MAINDDKTLGFTIELYANYMDSAKVSFLLNLNDPVHYHTFTQQVYTEDRSAFLQTNFYFPQSMFLLRTQKLVKLENAQKSLQKAKPQNQEEVSDVTYPSLTKLTFNLGLFP